MSTTIDVLIVEDSPTQAQQLQRALEGEGYQTSVAKNGREGLVFLKECKARVILSDINMPEMDGYEFCKTIKEDRNLKDIPVILMTSLVDSSDIIRGLECGASNFFTKPIDNPQLISRIRYIFANRDMRKGRSAQFSLEFIFAGKQYRLDADRMQILDLLLSTYETAVQKNVELIRVQKELQHLNKSLEAQVLERTATVTTSNAELQAKIASLKQSEEGNQKLQSQLVQAQKMESIGRLAGGVAHDFNNILTAVSGYSHFLLNALSPEDPNRSDVEEIKMAGERAAALTRQLLAFSRQQVLQPKVLDLNALVHDIEMMLRRIIGEDMDLHSQLAEDLGRISADPGQVEQVLLNLVVNARDAMPKGGKITIETANVELNEDYCRAHLGARPGPHVMLAVSDTGTGMDAETLSRLFEPFFTTKEQGKGTGLGLATVYGIVKQSGGSVFVYSEPGQGSVFKVHLPRVQKKAVGPAAAVAPTTGVSHQGSETVLLVEDDEMVRKFVLRLLSQNGYTMLEARNPEEAFRICERHADQIHLLLTDIVMPGMRGDDMAKRLCTQRPDMKVILMSGYTEAGLIRHDFLGSDAVFIQKPLDPALLTSKVREMLDGPGAKRS